MNSWKIILATIVIFGAGVMTGGLLVNHIDHSHPKNPRHPETTASATNSASPTNPTNSPGQPGARSQRLPEILNKQFLQRLNEELHLTAEQHEAIQKIITDSQNQMRKTILDARLEIREQLTPEQQKLFEELIKQRPPKPGSAEANKHGTNLPPANSPPAPAPTNAPGV
jgi:hypothetical protein